jgi:chemotaxis protein MotD
MRAAQAGEAKVDAGPSADRPVAERVGGGPASATESRALSGGQPQPTLGLPVSAVQQIADRIVTALEAATDVRPPSAPGVAGQSSAAAAQLKVLHIELQPAELGTIEIQLSLREDALELRLDASRAETAALIGRDKDALAGLLRSAGYLIDAMTVQIAEPDRGAGTAAQPSSQGSHTPSQSMTHTQSGGSQADARSDRADRQPQGDHRSNPVERDEHASDQPSLRHADGAVYV